MKKFYKFVTASLLAAFSVSSALADEPAIYGSMIANDSWGQWDREEGIYEFSPVADTPITAVFTDGYDLDATAGGVLVGNVYHLFSNRGGGWFPVSYQSFFIDSWELDYSGYFSAVIISNDMACDPTCDLVYCAQKDDTAAGKLVTWDPEKIDNITEVGKLDVEILAIAADRGGQLYGVGDDGNFYSIDKSTAELTLVGSTGVKPTGLQSAVFDLDSGKLYWAAYLTDGTSALYGIDTATGEASKISDFKNNARFCGLYMLSSGADPNAPAAVADLAADFAKGATSGKVSFTLPVSRNDGSALSGELEYRLDVDGQTRASGKKPAGTKVEVPLELENGNHQFMLTVSNDDGESPRAKLSIYVGKAKPGAVDYPKVEPTGEPAEFLVSWNPSDYGIPYEAYFDPAEVRYTVVRHPDEVTVADRIASCSVKDKIDYNGELKVFSYEITPFVDDLEGVPYTTLGVAVGQPLTPPYQVAMKDADLGMFTIIDANNDNSSWAKDLYGYGVSCGGRWGDAGDDWLILPPLALEADGYYRTVINVGNDYDGPSAYEIKLGKTPTVAGMTSTVQEKTSTVNSFNGDIRVPEDGTYYIGIHCMGAAGTTMYVTDIIVRNQANLSAPAEPLNLTGKGAEKGELAAYVTFTTPSISISGDRLDALTAVNIYHGEKLVLTLDKVEPDTEYTAKVEADQEFNTYSVAAVNEAGEGTRATVEYVFAGYDIPSPVTGVTLVENAQGQPEISWDKASEVGQYGFYVDPDDVTYLIYRGDGDNNWDLLEDGWNGNSYVDNKISPEHKQMLLVYAVYPVNSIGIGYGLQSNTECYGKPYDAPFVEKFADGRNQSSPWYFKTETPQNTAWMIMPASDTNLPDYDGSNGLAGFSAIAQGEATLHAPFISLQGLDDPILDFYYYADKLTSVPEVAVDGKVLDNEAPIASATPCWQRFKASLKEFKGSKRVRLTFTGRYAKADTYIFIDNVRLRNRIDDDMALSYIHVPAAMTLDEPCEVAVAVKNDGEKAAAGAKVTLYRNGFAVAEAETGAMESAEQKVLSFAQLPDVSFGENPTYKAVVAYDYDMDHTNDASDEVASALSLPRFPAPTDLEAETTADNSSVKLTWTAPTLKQMAPDPLTDDFEGYEAFTTDLAPWTTVDLDKQPTSVMMDPMSWTENLDYPHAGEPMAFQVFNPSKVGISDEYIFYQPHSGAQVAISWASADYEAANDDWLISPELYAGGQTISFYVYSRTGYFDSEKYEVLYSSTDAKPDSFTQLYADAALDEWTRIDVELPADARYFALRNVSTTSTTEIWFDDITYIPATFKPIELDLKGFNVYRDNELITPSPVADPEFTDAKAWTGKHKYNVTAFYGVGESAMSDAAYASVVSGIAEAAAARVKVAGETGRIRVTGAEGSQVAVYAIGGITLHNATAATNDLTIAAEPGAYVVVAAGKAFKVVVK